MKTFCEYYNAAICDSCRLIEVDRLKQVENKQLHLKSLIRKHSDADILPPVTSPPLAFRNKAKMAVTGSLDHPIIGLPGDKKDLDSGREILHCPVHHPRINEIIDSLTEFIQLCRVAPYQISSKKGELKGVILYHSSGTDECYLRFVLRSRESVDRIKKNLSFLLTKHSFLKCVTANIQPIPHALLEGEEEIFLTEREHINYQLGKLTINLAPKGFVQTNQFMAQQLYQTAANWVRELNTDKFAELFCGQGAFSFMLSSVVKKGMGFEINPEAVKEANATANKLQLHHLTFKCSDAAHVKVDLCEFDPDLVLVNPPRRGLGESIQIFLDRSWPYLIYSSCSPETLDKDLEKLTPKYRILKAQLFDMFPHTEHFETLVLLTSSENE